MRRILMMLLRNLIYLPGMIWRLFYHANHVEKYTDEEHDLVLKNIVEHANKGGNVKLRAVGVENIPKENGYMLFPNHQGMYDMLAIVGTSPLPTSMVAKKEVENVLFLKQVLQCTKGFSIDRENIRQSMEVIINITKEVKKGRNYTIFAEGTRSKNGNNTLEFKGGSFKAATKARCPIVPVALINSFMPFDSKSLKEVIVEVHYLPPLTYEVYESMKTTEIAIYVRNEIQKVLDQYNTK
ncbi:MAG: lysophospholipid acyltransferase family protein [Eubacteriales bacterium]